MEQREQHEHDMQELGRQWERLGLKRRDFLRLLAAGASTATVAGVLAACGGETAAPTTGTRANTTTTTTTTTTAAGGAATRTTAPAVVTTTRATGTTTRAGGGAPAGARDYPSGGEYSTLEPVRKKGGRLVEGSFADAETMNGMLVSDTTSGAIVAMIGNGLLDINPDNGQLFPDLATEVPTQENGGISADGLTHTFKLRTDVKFHDGRPLTAKDVVYTYTTMQNPASGSPRAGELTERVESVTAQGDNTVVIKLKKVVASFLVQNAGYAIVPEHILGQVPLDQLKSHPFSTGTKGVTIYTGPFQFDAWERGNQIVITKNPSYFDGEPALDQFILKIVKDFTVSVAQLKTGELDYGPISEPFFEEMGRQTNINLAKYDTYSFTYYVTNLDTAKTTLFQDPKVRQAMAYAINREQMIRAIRFGLGKVAIGTMPVLSWAYNPDAIRNKYPFDQNRARQLLDEAGWRPGPDGIRVKDGQPLRFTIWTNAGNNIREQYVTVLQQQWRAIGIDCTPRTEEWAALLARFGQTFDYECLLIGFSWGVEPDQSTMWKTTSYPRGFNRNKYSNPRVDELLDQGQATLDQGRRKQIYTEMQNIIMDDLPSNILDFPQALAGVNKRVHNLKPNAINVRWNAHTWWVE